MHLILNIKIKIILYKKIISNYLPNTSSYYNLNTFLSNTEFDDNIEYGFIKVDEDTIKFSIKTQSKDKETVKNLIFIFQMIK